MNSEILSGCSGVVLQATPTTISLGETRLSNSPMPPEGFHAISGTLSNQQETPQPFEQVLRQTPGTSHEPAHLGWVQ